MAPRNICIPNYSCLIWVWREGEGERFWNLYLMLQILLVNHLKTFSQSYCKRYLNLHLQQKTANKILKTESYFPFHYIPFCFYFLCNKALDMWFCTLLICFLIRFMAVQKHPSFVEIRTIHCVVEMSSVSKHSLLCYPLCGGGVF